MKSNPATALRGGLRAATVVAALLTLLIGATPVAAASATSGSSVKAQSSGGSKASLSGVVNVNTASVEELQLLPGVGTSRASAIVAARKNRGGFETIDQLTEVKGIGPSMLERMRPHVAVEGRTTARRAPKQTRSGSAASRP